MLAFQPALPPSWSLDSVLSLHPDAVQLELGSAMMVGSPLTKAVWVFNRMRDLEDVFQILHCRGLVL